MVVDKEHAKDNGVDRSRRGIDLHTIQHWFIIGLQLLCQPIVAVQNCKAEHYLEGRVGAAHGHREGHKEHLADVHDKHFPVESLVSQPHVVEPVLNQVVWLVQLLFVLLEQSKQTEREADDPDN